MKIDIGNDFSKLVGVRTKEDGDFSGEEFRENFLEPAMHRNQSTTILLDSLEGYTASFMEEAFGGIVRKHGQKAFDLIKFEAKERAYLIPQIRTWMKEAL